MAELPEDGRVVIRKIKPIYSTTEEKQKPETIIGKASAIKDFFIYVEEYYLYVCHSQFSSTGGQDESLSRKEVIELMGDNVER